MSGKWRMLKIALMAATAAWLAGCAGSPPPPQPLLRLEAHGNTLSAARQAALQQAEGHCEQGEPVVIDSQQQHTGPRFQESASALPLAQSELGEYAAATHEGEAPSIIWRYHCR